MSRVDVSRAAALCVRSMALLAVLNILAGCNTNDSESTAESGAARMTVADIPDGVGGGFPFAAIASDSDKGPAPKERQPAPEFALEFDDGRSLQLSDLRGSPVMINFWATWCPPCRSEMPEIVRQAENREELIVLAVNVNEDDSVMRSFADHSAMKLPVVMDRDGRLADLYLVRGMPTSVFIDREAVIVSVWEGMLSTAQLESHLAAVR